MYCISWTNSFFFVFFIYMYIKYSIQLHCFARFSLMGARERMVNRRIMGASSIWKCMWIWSHRFRIDIYSFLHTVLFSSLLSFWLKLSRYWDFNRIPRLFFRPSASVYDFWYMPWSPIDVLFTLSHCTFCPQTKYIHGQQRKKNNSYNKTYSENKEEKNVERPIRGRKDNDTVVHCSHINPFAITWHYQERK